MQNTIKLVLAILALLAGFYASDLIVYLQPHVTKRDISQYCALSTQPCQQHGISMTLSQDTVQPLDPATIWVEWPDTASKQLELSLQGLEMEMGTAKFLLTKTVNGIFTNRLVLPVCTMQSMTWVGTVTDGHTTAYLSIRMEQ